MNDDIDDDIDDIDKEELKDPAMYNDLESKMAALETDIGEGGDTEEDAAENTD